MDYQAARVVLSPLVLDGRTDILREIFSAGVLGQFQVLVLRVLLDAHVGDVVWIVRADVVHESDSFFLYSLGLLWLYHFGVHLIRSASLASFRGRNSQTRIISLA